MYMGRCTVLGASGFIGGHLARHLVRLGHDCRTPPRDAPLWEEDLGDVYYCIGLTADFRSRPFDALEAHVGRLLDVLRRARFRSLLYLSSTRVYQHQPLDRPAREEDRLTVAPSDPSDLYNLSKLAGEAACLAHSNPAVRVLRLSNVYGPGDCSGNFLASVLAEARDGNLVFRTAPESAKDYIAVEDVVAMLPRIASRGTRRVYNIASGRNVTHAELARELARHFGCRIAFAPEAPPIRFPPIAIDRAASEFGFAPRPLDLGPLVHSG